MDRDKLQELLKRIKTKLENGFVVSEYEWSLYVLYRDSEEAQ